MIKVLFKRLVTGGQSLLARASLRKRSPIKRPILKSSSIQIYRMGSVRAETNLVSTGKRTGRQIRSLTIHDGIR